MAAAKQEVDIIINGINKAKGVFKAMEKDLRAISTVALAVGAAMTAGIGKAVVEAARLESALAEVATIAPAVRQNFEGFRRDIVDLSVEMGINGVESTNALYQAISAGVRPAQALDFLRVSAQLAVGGITDLKTSTDGLTTIMNAFQLSSEDSAENLIALKGAADTLFTAVRLGKTTVSEFSATISVVAPNAAVMGIRFEEVAAAMATITKQGVPTGQAFNQINAFLIALQRKTKDMEEAFDLLGVASGKELVEKFGGLQGAMEALRQISEDTGREIIEFTGRQEAMQAVLLLTGKNARGARSDLAQFRDEIKAGAAEDAFLIILESTSKQFEILQTGITAVSQEIGAQLLPAFAPLLKSMNEAIKETIIWIRESQAFAEIAREIGDSLGSGFIPRIKALTEFMRKNVEQVKEWAVQLFKTVKFVGIAGLIVKGVLLLTSKIGLATVAIAAATAAWVTDFKGVRTEISKVGTTFAKELDQIAGQTGFAQEFVSASFDRLLEVAALLGVGIVKVFAGIGQTLLGEFKAVGVAFEDIFVLMFNFGRNFDEALEVATKAWSVFAAFMQEAFLGAINNIRFTFNKFQEGFQRVIGAVVGVIPKFGKKWKEQLKEMADANKQFADEILEKNVFDTTRKQIDKLQEAVDKVTFTSLFQGMRELFDDTVGKGFLTTIEGIANILTFDIFKKNEEGAKKFAEKTLDAKNELDALKSTLAGIEAEAFIKPAEDIDRLAGVIQKTFANSLNSIVKTADGFTTLGKQSKNVEAAISKLGKTTTIVMRKNAEETKKAQKATKDVGTEANKTKDVLIAMGNAGKEAGVKTEAGANQGSSALGKMRVAATEVNAGFRAMRDGIANVGTTAQASIGNTSNNSLRRMGELLEDGRVKVKNFRLELQKVGEEEFFKTLPQLLDQMVDALGGVSLKDAVDFASEERRRRKDFARGINPDTGLPDVIGGTGFAGVPNVTVAKQQRDAILRARGINPATGLPFPGFVFNSDKQIYERPISSGGGFTSGFGGTPIPGSGPQRIPSTGTGGMLASSFSRPTLSEPGSSLRQFEGQSANVTVNMQVQSGADGLFTKNLLDEAVKTASVSPLRLTG